MCRCRETATIAFGDRYETDPLLRAIASADASRTSAFEAKAQSMIPPRGRKPVVFVSHRPNIDVLTLELVDEGELPSRARTGRARSTSRPDADRGAP
ncbi:MAG: hypothetical protein IPF73_05500 [Betaproteobacteria bacterium]|nr:hypothetical protein [Betaproteobacteria bacterium]